MTAEASVHWMVQDFADVPAGDDWLSGRERENLDRLRFPKRRNDWRLGRWTAKRLAACFLAVPSSAEHLATLEIRPAPGGAPEVYLLGSRAAISLSISHSSGIGFCAAAPPGVGVGCDLEHVQEHEPGFADDYFAEEENILLHQVPPSELPFAATLIWSVKESALKVLREGLRRDTRSVIADLDLNAGKEAWNPLRVRCSETARVFCGWWRFPCPYVLTIAATQPIALAQAPTQD